MRLIMPQSPPRMSPVVGVFRNGLLGEGASVFALAAGDSVSGFVVLFEYSGRPSHSSGRTTMNLRQ